MAKTFDHEKIKKMQMQKEQQTIIKRAMIIAGFKKEAARISQCLEYWDWDTYKPEKIMDLIRVSRCKSKWCANCQGLYAAQISTQISTQMMSQNLTAYHLTLTVKNCRVTELESQLKKMSSAFSRLWQGWKNLTENQNRKGPKGCLSLSAAFRSIEITESEKGYLHPHIHAILATDEPIKKELLIPRIIGRFDKIRKVQRFLSPIEEMIAAEWARALRLDYQPEIKLEPIQPERIKEALKYPLKPSSINDMSPAKLGKVIAATKKVNMFARFGSFRGIKETDEICESDSLQTENTKIVRLFSKPTVVLTGLYDIESLPYSEYTKIARSKQEKELGIAILKETDDTKNKKILSITINLIEDEIKKNIEI
jgi:plasmid rolling circle replication initiator protein Rep